MGHTDKSCPKLLDIEEGDGSRGWGEELRHVTRRIGTTATNTWLQDPIPSMWLKEGAMSGEVQNVASAGKSNVGSSTMVTLDGRINVVHHEISVIKTGILVAQLSTLTRRSKSLLGAAFSSGSMLPSPNTHMFTNGVQ